MRENVISYRRTKLSEVEKVETVEQGITYVLYSHGRTKLVSKKEWEQSWLDWWMKINKVRELE